MSANLSTAWRGNDLLVLRDDEEIERIAADQIERVIQAYAGAGDSPGDLVYAIIETATDVVVLPADSGISGRVNFERQPFWAERRCVYWVAAARATLPRPLRAGHWPLRRDRPAYVRLKRADLCTEMAQWPLEGPQTWDERKWERIARSRAL